jgi:GDP-mannose pyrophosphatase NudK
MQERIKNLSARLLSRSWTTLQCFTFDFESNPGRWEKQKREVYDRGNGVCALLYDPQRKKVLLVKQFRLPTYLNGNKSGELIEACAGKMSPGEEPLKSIEREVLEELGHGNLHFKKVFEAYMSPGSVTEKIHFYIAEYSQGTKLSEGGGLPEEQENIEVLEVDLQLAVDMISSGKIQDAKTIILIQYLQLKMISKRKEQQ